MNDKEKDIAFVVFPGLVMAFSKLGGENLSDLLRAKL
jgi:hypothetical protein